MRGFFRFISSGRVWMNVFLILITIALIVFLTMQWLAMYTMHGETIYVPKIEGKSVHEIEVLLSNSDMTFEVTDSIYSEDFARGVVVSQNPPAGQSVKKGRTVYLTINSTVPEMVIVPDLIGKSKRIAVPILEISGLELNSLKYRPDETCTDCVVGLEYQGEPVLPGEELRKGEKVNLILGQSSNETTITPNLLGLKYSEASQLIISHSLNVGSVLACSGCESADDTTNAFVVNQRPQRNEMIKLGTFIDLYLSGDSSMAAALRAPIDTTSDEFD